MSTPPAVILPPCPATPNCVSTQAERAGQRMDPIPFQGSLESARSRMRRALESIPRTRIVQEDPALLRAECRSRIFRFVDDVEVRFDDAAKLVHFRSASRLGRKDFGVNRARMELVRKAFLAAS